MTNNNISKDTPPPHLFEAHVTLVSRGLVFLHWDDEAGKGSQFPLPKRGSRVFPEACFGAIPELRESIAVCMRAFYCDGGYSIAFEPAPDSATDGPPGKTIKESIAKLTDYEMPPKPPKI